MKLTQEQAQEKINKKHNNTILLNSNYFGYPNRHSFKCLICNHVWNTTFNAVANKTGCPKCANHILTENDIMLKLKERYLNKISLIKTFKEDRLKGLFKCEICGYEWVTIPKNIIYRNRGCAKCAGKRSRKNSQLTIDIILKRMFEVHENNISLLEEYKGSVDSKHRFKCNKCQHIWEATIASVTKLKSGCPKCKISKGEKAVEKWLKENNYQYKIQYRFEEENKKPYDFYVITPNANKEYLLIEIQGIQHFKPIKQFGGQKSFEKLQKTDIERVDFCYKNNIRLLRLKYECQKIKNLIQNLDIVMDEINSGKCIDLIINR